MLYDLGSKLTVIPRSDGYDGWFNETTAQNVTIEDSWNFEHTLWEETFNCTMAYGNLCGNNADSTVSQENNCAYMGVCLTVVDSIPEGYEGIVGLGRWNRSDTDINYIME